jgi:hypothetical protein
MIRSNRNPLAKLLLATLFVWITAFSIQAQDEKPDLQRELTLEKEYSPNLRDADKLHRLPEIKEPEAPKVKVDLSNYTLEHPLAPYFRQLGVVNYFPEFADSNKRGYLTAGLGTPINLDWDAGYQILQSADDRLSIFASERITNGRANYLQRKENGDIKINDLLLGLDFKHRFAKAAWSADIRYDRSSFNYYGSPTMPEMTPVPIEDQLNNRLSLRTGIVSSSDQRLQYRLNAQYTSLKQRVEQAENRIIFDGGLYSPFKSAAGIGLDLALKTYAYKVRNDDTKNYTSFSVNPYLTIEGDAWDVRLGAKASLLAGGRKAFLPSPDIRFRWRPDEAVLLYFTAEGGIQDNSLYNSFYENRYLHPDSRIYDSRSPLDGTLGVTFSPTVNLSVDLFTGYKWVKDEHFYLRDIYWNYLLYPLPVTILPHPLPLLLLEEPPMRPQYADANVFKVGVSAKYQYQDRLDLSMKLVYNRWKVTDIQTDITLRPVPLREAWNKPVFTGDWAIGVKLPTMPLRIDLNYHLETGRKTWIPNENSVDAGNLVAPPYPGATLKMKNIHAANATLSYPLTQSLSIYGKANNLFFQKYDLWYGYPAQGFHLMLGAALKF